MHFISRKWASSSQIWKKNEEGSQLSFCCCQRWSHNATTLVILLVPCWLRGCYCILDTDKWTNFKGLLLALCRKLSWIHLPWPRYNKVQCALHSHLPPLVAFARVDVSIVVDVVFIVENRMCSGGELWSQHNRPQCHRRLLSRSGTVFVKSSERKILLNDKNTKSNLENVY